MSDTLKRPTAALLSVLAIAGRFLPHPPNFTPVGAAALFGGAKLERPWNYLLPLAVLVISDLFLGQHSTMIYVYGSFLFMAWLGERLNGQSFSVWRVSGYSLLGSLTFFLVTNFGVWLQGGLYPHTVDGLVRCYVMAIPFFGPTIAGDVIYSLGFFGIYALAERRGAIPRFDKKLVGWLR